MKKLSRNKIQGFTLIEAVIYIALFSIIIGGATLVTYGIIQSYAQTTNLVTLQDEGNFLLRKISWALTGATAINIISNRLEVTRNSTAPQTYSFNLCSNNLTIQIGAAKTCADSPITLNSSSVLVSLLTFNKIGTNGVTITFTLTTAQDGRNASETFSITKYLRQ